MMLLIGMSAVLRVCQIADADLIQNGSFEIDSDTDYVPDDWIITDPDWSLTGEDRVEGALALKIKGTDGRHKWKTVTSPEIIVQEGDLIEYSLWCKTTDASVTYDLTYWLQKWEDQIGLRSPLCPAASQRRGHTFCILYI